MAQKHGEIVREYDLFTLSFLSWHLKVIGEDKIENHHARLTPFTTITTIFPVVGNMFHTVKTV